MLTGFHIVLIEDDEIMGASLAQRLKLEGAGVTWHKQTRTALGAIRSPRTPIDAVICDIRLPDGTGEELFSTLCHTSTPPPFLFITGHGDIAQAVRLMRAGAVDYVSKPFEMAVFLERLTMLLMSHPKQEMPLSLGISAAARRVDSLALKAAKVDRPVLIIGGPGTGKKLVAQRIHKASDRRSAPFISVNLAREADAKRALFGPDGAWGKVGEGVLFINAFSRISVSAQAALLTAVEAGFAGRIIASCGQEMSQIVAVGQARADFFYRLNMMEIPIPPLASRNEDAVWLMLQLFHSLNERLTRPLKGISTLCEEAVRMHDWPGGGRELRARLQRGLENAESDLLQPVDIFPETVVSPEESLTLAEVRDAAERSQIIDTLALTGGQISKAAGLLKVSRTTLWQKMQKLGVAPNTD